MYYRIPDNWDVDLFNAYNGDVWSDAEGGYINIFEEQEKEMNKEERK